MRLLSAAILASLLFFICVFHLSVGLCFVPLQACVDLSQLSDGPARPPPFRQPATCSSLAVRCLVFAVTLSSFRLSLTWLVFVAHLLSCVLCGIAVFISISLGCGCRHVVSPVFHGYCGLEGRRSVSWHRGVALAVQLMLSIGALCLPSYCTARLDTLVSCG